MLMIFPPEATWFAAGSIATLVALFAIRARQKGHALTTNAPHDPEPAIRDLTEKVRHPWRYRAKRLLGLRQDHL